MSTESCADPTVWRDDASGIFHLFATGAFDRHLMLSSDMVHWRDAGHSPLTDRTIEQIFELADSCGSDYCFYAPTVVRNGDKWLMYVSLTHKCMVVLESERVDSGFHFADNKPYILVDEKVTGLDITFEDSFVARNDDGRLFLMWGSHGNLYRCVLTDDGLHIAENAVFEHFAGNPRSPSRIYEGVYAYYREGWWYIFAARGQYNSKRSPYRVVVGRARHLDDVFRSKGGLRMSHGFATLILKPDDMSEYLGGGHTGEIFTDDNGNDYIFYQRQIATKEHYRCLFLQRIFWDKNGWPYFKDGKCQMEDVTPRINTPAP